MVLGTMGKKIQKSLGTMARGARRVRRNRRARVRKLAVKNVSAPIAKAVGVRLRYMKPKQKDHSCRMQFSYKSGGKLTGATAQFQPLATFKLNSMWDFESGTTMENKQPLFFDQYISATNGYLYYKVEKWRTGFTLVNFGADALTIFYTQIDNTAKVDSITDSRNNTFVRKYHLGAKGSHNDKIYIKARGTPEQVLGWLPDPQGLLGSSTTDPSNVCYGYLSCYNQNNTNGAEIGITMNHTYYCRLSDINQVQS